jgi:hypothetical protein
MTSKKHSGSFVSVSDTAISYRETTGERSIPKQDVVSVKLLEHKHRLRNTPIVVGVGAGIGAGIGAALHKSCSSQSFCLDIGGAALPAGIGAVVGGLGGRRRWGSLALSHHDLPGEPALTCRQEDNRDSATLPATGFQPLTPQAKSLRIFRNYVNHPASLIGLLWFM